MTQETVRFSELIVDEVETLVADGIFDNKSEFYRFATESVLDSFKEDYSPEMVNYDQFNEELRDQTLQANQSTGDGSSFYHSAITVRRYARHGDGAAAEEHIDSHYPPERGEYLLLEALLDYYHNHEQS